jgi:hypothetical protein
MGGAGIVCGGMDSSSISVESFLVSISGHGANAHAGGILLTLVPSGHVFSSAVHAIGRTEISLDETHPRKNSSRLRAIMFFFMATFLFQLIKILLAIKCPEQNRINHLGTKTRGSSSA